MKNTRQITFGGGCFWCTEAIFRDTNGIVDVKSGYSGGKFKNPTYKEVCYGRTGHAEVVQVTYNPDVISLEEIFIIHFLTHDPTTIDKQGPDKGTQYRSIIFYQTEEEKQLAESVRNELQAVFDNPIVTEIVPFVAFYEAEEVHQKYYEENADAMYCRVVITPKLAKYRQLKEKLKLADQLKE